MVACLPDLFGYGRPRGTPPPTFHTVLFPQRLERAAGLQPTPIPVTARPTLRTDLGSSQRPGAKGERERGDTAAKPGQSSVAMQRGSGATRGYRSVDRRFSVALTMLTAMV